MRERGSITLWLLGLAFAFLTLGVLSVDLWSLVGHRRELAGLADASATAAASAVDEAAWRNGHGLRLDRAEATARAWSVLARGAGIDDEPAIHFESDGVTVRVSVSRTVETALLGLAGRDFVTIGDVFEATEMPHPKNEQWKYVELAVDLSTASLAGAGTPLPAG
jgi:hypothetical protein